MIQTTFQDHSCQEQWPFKLSTIKQNLSHFTVLETVNLRKLVLSYDVLFERNIYRHILFSLKETLTSAEFGECKNKSNRRSSVQINAINWPKRDANYNCFCTGCSWSSYDSVYVLPCKLKTNHFNL